MCGLYAGVCLEGTVYGDILLLGVCKVAFCIHQVCVNCLEGTRIIITVLVCSYAGVIDCSLVCEALFSHKHQHKCWVTVFFCFPKQQQQTNKLVCVCVCVCV